MAISAKFYGEGFLSIFNKEIDWEDDTIKCALLRATYTPDADNHRYFSAVADDDLPTGDGYTARGQLLTGRLATYDDPTNVLKLDADDVSWPNSSLTAAYAVIYRDTGTDATSSLIGYVDFGGLFASSNSTFSLIWNPAGVFAVTVA